VAAAPVVPTDRHVFMDGVWHKRSWGGAVENVSVLVAIGVGSDGRREVIGVAEGMTGGRRQLEPVRLPAHLTGACRAFGWRPVTVAPGW
jgi:hypothetical protein